MANHYHAENREDVLFYRKPKDEARIIRWLGKTMGRARIGSIAGAAVDGNFNAAFLAFSNFIYEQLPYSDDRLDYIIKNNMFEYGDSEIIGFLFRHIIGQPYKQEAKKSLVVTPSRSVSLSEAISQTQSMRKVFKERYFIVPDKEGRNTKAVVRAYVKYDRFIVRLYSPQRKKWVKLTPRVRKELGV